MRSVVVLDRRPLLDDVRHPRVGQDDDGHVVLKVHAVRAPLDGGKRDVGIRVLKVRRRISDGNEYLAGTCTWPPQEVVVMSADDGRKATGSGQLAEGARFTVVAGRHTRLCALLRRQTGIDPLNGVGEAIPAKSIFECLRDGLVDLHGRGGRKDGHDIRRQKYSDKSEKSDISGPDPGELRARYPSLEHHRSGRKQDGQGRSQEVGLRAQEREHQIDEDECPAQKTKASARLAKVENQAGNGQRDGDRIHQGEFRSKEVEGTGADAAVVVPELKCGPAVERVPNEIRQQAQKRDAARQPWPPCTQVSPLGRDEQRQEQRETEEEHCQLGQESDRGDQTDQQPQAGRVAAQQPRHDETGKGPPELIEHIHGEDGPGCHEVEAEHGCNARQNLGHPATTQLACDEAGDDDDQGARECRDNVDCHQAVADRYAHERGKPAHEKRLVDVASLEMMPVGDVVQLVPKVAVVPGDEHVSNERGCTESY